MRASTAQPNPYENGAGDISALAPADNSNYVGAIFAHSARHGAEAHTLRGGTGDARPFQQQASQSSGMELHRLRSLQPRDEATAAPSGSPRTTATTWEPGSEWDESDNVYGEALEWNDLSV